MRFFSLDSRLSFLAGLVPAGARLADVGAGHGKLSLYLLHKGRLQSAVLSDLSEKSLLRARELKERHLPSADVRFFVSDGLSHLTEGDCDTIVVAGMGGNTIAEILDGAPFPLAGKRLILQPMSSPEDLRTYLHASRLGIADEYLVEDAGRLYLVLTSPGEALQSPSPADLYLGRGLAESPLFARHREAVLARLSDMERGCTIRGRAEERDTILSAIREISKGEDDDNCI